MASIIIAPETARRVVIAGMVRVMRPATASIIIVLGMARRVAITGMARGTHLAMANIITAPETAHREASAGMARVMPPATASIIIVRETVHRVAIVGMAKVTCPAMAKAAPPARLRAMVSLARMRRSLGATGQEAAVFLTERRVATVVTAVPRASAASIASAKVVRAKDSEAGTRAERV
jgi:hypothetical protein